MTPLKWLWHRSLVSQFLSEVNPLQSLFVLSVLLMSSFLKLLPFLNSQPPHSCFLSYLWIISSLLPLPVFFFFQYILVLSRSLTTSFLSVMLLLNKSTNFWFQQPLCDDPQASPQSLRTLNQAIYWTARISNWVCCNPPLSFLCSLSGVTRLHARTPGSHLRHFHRHSSQIHHLIHSLDSAPSHLVLWALLRYSSKAPNSPSSPLQTVSKLKPKWSFLYTNIAIFLPCLNLCRGHGRLS